MRLCLLMCSNDRTLRQQVLFHRLALRNSYLDVCQRSTSEKLITQTVKNCRQNSNQNIAVVWITYSELYRKLLFKTRHTLRHHFPGRSVFIT